MKKWGVGNGKAKRSGEWFFAIFPKNNNMTEKYYVTFDVSAGEKIKPDRPQLPGKRVRSK